MNIDEHGVNAADVNDPPFLLRLYIAGQSSRSKRAVSNLRDFVHKHLPDANVEIVDIYQEQAAAVEANLIGAPTLVKRSPLPVRRIIGDLSNEANVASTLGLEANPD